MLHPAVSHAKSHLPVKASATLKIFLETFFARTPTEDLNQVDPFFLKHIAQTHFNITMARKKNVIELKQYITDDVKGLTEGRTVIDIVQNDAPFLLSS